MLLNEFIPDYMGSDHFLFLDQDLKKHAETILSIFCDECRDPVTSANTESGLKKVLNQPFSATVKKKFPSLIREFFSYLNSSGRLPEGDDLLNDIDILEPQLINKIREDGSIKGTTHTKKYTDVGRNDPCPCGSGKKFKKCCMSLLSG